MALIEEYCKEKDLNFDEARVYGKIGEELADAIFEGNLTCEVKTERNQWKKTGNIAIEYMSRGEWSGITTTKAEIWVHFLSFDGKVDGGGFVFKVKKLRDYISKNKDKLRRVFGGDDNTSHLILLNNKEIGEIYEL